MIAALLTSVLAAGVPVTSIPCSSLGEPLGSGQTISVGYGTPNAQSATVSANVAAGATSIPVSSFNPVVTFAAGTVIADQLGVVTSPLQGSVQQATAGFQAPGQSIKNYTGKVALSTTGIVTVPLETVTAGKTYVITDIYITGDTAQVIADVQIQAAGTPIFRGVVKGDTAPIALAGLESQPSASSGQQVNLVLPQVAAGENIIFFIGGFEK